ncbi:hypothetical protein PMAYCL1PPCAC_27879, partial [Pristionchus mayeri]
LILSQVLGCPESKKLLKCSYCDQLFGSIDHRYNHIQFVHLMQSYACITCGKEFDGDVELWQHLRDNEGHRRASSG